MNVILQRNTHTLIAITPMTSTSEATHTEEMINPARHLLKKASATSMSSWTSTGPSVSERY